VTRSAEMSRSAEPLDEDAHDESEVELIDLSRPVHRGVVNRPPRYAPHPGHLGVAELRLAEIHLGVTRYADRVTGLIVGENPGPNTHPDLPLFPWPPTSSAGRLLAMSRLEPGVLLGSLYRRNLVDDRYWDREDAALRARSIVTALFDQPRDLRVLLCGKRVARAFGFKDLPTWYPHKMVSRQVCAVIPHPSGMNRVYNDSEARERTGGWIRWAVGLEEIK
jgi:hypothetical protein